MSVTEEMARMVQQIVQEVLDDATPAQIRELVFEPYQSIQK